LCSSGGDAQLIGRRCADRRVGCGVSQELLCFAIFTQRSQAAWCDQRISNRQRQQLGRHQPSHPSLRIESSIQIEKDGPYSFAGRERARKTW
jgi:hypothetical protein